jgi:hypothetical protein
MVGALITLLIVLLVAALVFWVLQQLGLPDPIRKIVYVVVVVVLAIWLLYFLIGFLPAGTGLPAFPRRS